MLDQPTLVKATVITVGVFTFCLFVSACTVANQCYVTPCEAGDGVDMVWSVHPGTSFQLIVVSMFTMVHAYFLVNVLFKSSHSNMKYGMLMASTGLLCVVMMLQIVNYSSKSSMMSELQNFADDKVAEALAAGEITDHQSEDGRFAAFFQRSTECSKFDGNATILECDMNEPCAYVQSGLLTGSGYKGCYKRMFVNTKVKQRFTVVSVFSTFLFLSYGALFLMLVRWQEDFGRGNTATAASGGMPGPSRVSRGSYKGYEEEVEPEAEDGVSYQDS